MNNLPLNGLKVIDLTRLLPGPVCTWHLASMGAHVIKVEDRGVGDYAKSFFQTEADIQANRPSVFYRSINTNKEVVYLDLKEPADKQAFLELVKTADMVIESFRPGVMDRLGLGPKFLMKIKPSLVYCAITGYGMTGSWKDKACHDINSLAITGVLHQMTDQDHRPIMANIQIADVLGGAVTAAMGSLAALWKSLRTGVGSIVDVSMTDGVLAHNLTAQVAVHQLGHAKLAMEDLLNGGVPCYNLYQAKDGTWLALGALELKFWQNFCEGIGRPIWGKLHWSLGLAVGSQESLALRAKVQDWMMQKDRSEWLSILENVDCCITPVLSLEESMNHALFQERAMVSKDQEGQSWIQSPVKFS